MTDIIAAGILFLTKDNQALFLKRSAEGDCAGMWCLPGGKVEEGESLEQAARREANEEIGKHPDGELLLLTRRVRPVEVVVPTAAGGASDGIESPLVPVDPLPIVDFTTFVQRIDAPFEPTLNNEHDGYAWAPISSPPEPLHPGCRVVCARPNMNELDVARAMVAGELEGSQHFINMTMFAMRITGTGLAYRIGLDEHVWRRPEIYLNPEFLARCNGLPVVVQHPETRTLNSQEFADRIVGTIFLPYIQGDEVWGIAKIWDDTTVEMLDKHQLSTSPGVQFRNPKVDNSKLAGTDGSVLLIEGNPVLLDHLAICQKGVWDKGGEPRGIQFETREDSVMTEAERKALAARAAAGDEKAKLELARADSEGGDDKDKSKADEGGDDVKGLLSKVLDSIGGLSKRMDSYDEKEKAKADAEEKAKADAEEEAKAKADAEAEEKRAKGDEDQAKKDADEAKAKADADEKAKADAARADAETTRKAIEDLRTQMPVQLTDADYTALTDAQAKADSIMSLDGKSAPRPLHGDTPMAYRRRMATTLKAHSKHWKDVDLTAIADEAAFANIENAIYADAAEALRNPVDLPEGQLREVTRPDVTGRRITSFNGQPSAWMSQFSGHRRRLTGIRNAS